MIRIDKNDPKNDPLLAALAGVGVILTFAALIAVYGLPFKYLPEVMIGEEGLREMQKYLHILLLGQVIVLGYLFCTHSRCNCYQCPQVIGLQMSDYFVKFL